MVGCIPIESNVVCRNRWIQISSNSSSFQGCHKGPFSDRCYSYYSLMTCRNSLTQIAFSLPMTTKCTEKLTADNMLELNIAKCNIISFTNKLNPIVFDYFISTTKIQRVNVVKDLGVYFDSQLSFDHHVDKITRKAYRFIGFMFRSGQHFGSLKNFFRLYNSYVRGGLEYCSSIWSPFYHGYMDKLEKVQNRFTRLIYAKFRFPYQKSNVRLQQLEMHSLETRRILRDEIILFKIIHGIIDSNLLANIIFHHDNRTTRHNFNRTFYPKKSSSNFESHSPLTRMQNNHDCYFRNYSITDPNLKLSKFKLLINDHFPC